MRKTEKNTKMKSLDRGVGGGGELKKVLYRKALP